MNDEEWAKTGGKFDCQCCGSAGHLTGECDGYDEWIASGVEKINIQVIESIEEDGTEWGISFTCNNPEPEDYFKMPDGETAFRLKEKIDTMVKKYG